VCRGGGSSAEWGVPVRCLLSLAVTGDLQPARLWLGLSDKVGQGWAAGGGRPSAGCGAGATPNSVIHDRTTKIHFHVPKSFQAQHKSKKAKRKQDQIEVVFVESIINPLSATARSIRSGTKQQQRRSAAGLSLRHKEAVDGWVCRQRNVLVDFFGRLAFFQIEAAGV
jgi:hypothetical protein